jgi:hypothetical protein
MRYAFLAATVVLTLSAMAGCAATKADSADERLPRQIARRHHGERAGPSAPVRLRIDVYTLRTRPKNSKPLSVDALKDKAGDPEVLLDALNAYGNANLPYRFDQEIDLGVKTELALIQEVPYVKSVAASADGQFEAAPGYRDTGCVVEVSGEWAETQAGNVAQLLLMVQPSYVEPRKIDLGSGLYAPVISIQTVQQSVRLTDGVPAIFAMLSTPAVRSTDGMPAVFTMMNTFDAKKNEADGISEYLVRLQVDRLKEQP